MRPELKKLYAVASNHPEDADDCCVPMVATIGPLGGIAGDDFHFRVITTKYISKNWPLWGQHALVVATFDLPTVERFVKALLEERSGPTWHAIASDIHEFMGWEFHNYKSNA